MTYFSIKFTLILLFIKVNLFFDYNYIHLHIITKQTYKKGI